VFWPGVKTAASDRQVPRDFNNACGLRGKPVFWKVEKERKTPITTKEKEGGVKRKKEKTELETKKRGSSTGFGVRTK